VLLLTDEHVPQSVVDLFRARGHDVRLVTDAVGAGSADNVVTAAANEIGAIVVTWDKGFRQHIRRTGPLPNAGRILIQCDPATAHVRLAAVMPEIEALYAIRQGQPDTRLIVEVREQQIVIQG
jgi:predicted nuclease of predicted toxin-antitoxin system